MKRLSSFFESIDHIFPSQVRFSSENVREKIRKAEARKAFIIDKDHACTFAFDHGKSLYPIEKAVPAVIRSDNHFVLCDGHHITLASQYLNAKTLPICIIDDLSHLAEESFWHHMVDRGYAYLKNTDGKVSSPPTSFDDLIDDPLRYFIALSSRKFDEDLSVNRSRGADYPLWIKVGKDKPFIEFELADALYREHFQYVYGDEKKRMQELIEKARSILSKNSDFKNRIVKEKTVYDALEIKEIARGLL